LRSGRGVAGSLKTKPGLRRYLRRATAGLLRVDAAVLKREQHLARPEGDCCAHSSAAWTVTVR